MKQDPKLLAGLSYSLGIVSALIVLALVKKDAKDATKDVTGDAYVRFHAVQSILVFSTIAVASLLLPTVPVLGDWSAVRLLFVVAVIGLWGLLMIKGVQGEAYRLPYLGDLAASLTAYGK